MKDIIANIKHTFYKHEPLVSLHKVKVEQNSIILNDIIQVTNDANDTIK